MEITCTNETKCGFANVSGYNKAMADTADKEAIAVVPWAGWRFLDQSLPILLLLDTVGLLLQLFNYISKLTAYKLLVFHLPTITRFVYIYLLRLNSWKVDKKQHGSVQGWETGTRSEDAPFSKVLQWELHCSGLVLQKLWKIMNNQALLDISLEEQQT